MAQKIEKRRARRRRLTLTVAGRRRDDHLNRIHSGDTTNVDCVCELADTYFAKRAAVACNCRKRKKGNPRVSCGMCDNGSRDRIYAWRQEVRELRDAAMAGRLLDGEGPERHWPGSRTGPKEFSVEKRDINRAGKPAGTWHVVRSYRTAASRDNALRAFRLNVRTYDIRWMAPGEEAVYIGPRSEFRAGADPVKDG